MRALTFLCILLTQVTNPATADDPQNWSSHYVNICKDDRNGALDNVKAMPEAKAKAIAVRNAICSKKPTAPDLATIASYANDTLGLIEHLSPISIAQTKRMSATNIKSYLAASFPDGNSIPVAYVDCLTENQTNTCILTLEDDFDFDEGKCNAALHEIGITCKAFLNEFQLVYNFAQGSLSQLNAGKVASYISAKQKDWDRFVDESKSQTPLEMMINGWAFNRNSEAHTFQDPPDSQWIVMHPNLVVENVSDAIDGQQMKEALMIEVFGIDYWKQDIWYLPSGISLVGVYADRTNTEDIGYGVAIHFRSAFTIGVAKHNDEDGLFISIDLLKLIQDKKATIESYRGELSF